MKDLFKNVKLAIFVIFTSAMLQACGGSSNSADRYTISADVANVAFSSEVLQTSTDSIEVKVNFKGDGLLLGYAPDAQPAIIRVDGEDIPWLEFRTENITDTSATIHIDIVNAERLPLFNFETTLRISTGDVTNTTLVHHDIDVSLLVWQIFADTDLITFNGTFGDESIPSQTFELLSGANEWTVSSDVDWLSFSPSSGTGSTTITVTPTINTFTSAGLQQANITISEATLGDSQTLPVELGLDNVYLYADKATIAFTATPNVKATEQVVNIASNSPTTLTWTASTDATWLTLAPIEGTEQLSIIADATMAPSNDTSVASVTITATEASDVIAETITVSLYNSDQTTENKTITDIVVNSQAMVNAPSLPYTYIGTNNELRIYHQYTGELISSLTISPENTLLEQLLIHPNGHLMLAKADETMTSEDEQGNPIEEIVTHRYKINLSDLTFTEITEANIAYEPSQFVRLSGRYFVLTQTLELADDNLQRLFWDGQNAFFARGFDIAAQSNALYALDANDSSFKRYVASVNDFTSKSVSLELTHDYRPDLLPEELDQNTAIKDFVVTNNETGIYTISSTSEWISFDGTDFIDNGLLETNEDIVTLAIDKSSNGRAHYVRFDPTQGFLVNVYDEQQALSATILTNGNQPASVDISADDKRLALNATSSEQIEFISLKQFDSSATKLNFAMTFGDSEVTSQDITLTGIGENWTATSSQPWLILTPNNSGETATLTASIDTSLITGWGLFSATITVYDPASNSYSIITVEFAVDAVRLSSNYPALAFNQLATQQTLTHTVDVLFNGSNAVTWQASANVDWLTLTADVANNKLIITAVPENASGNIMHFGQVDITPVDSNDALAGKISVSLHKDVSDAADVTINDVSANSDAVAIDPLRPYIYVGIADSIKVYNVISGALVTSITSPLAGFDLTNLVIHPNGSMLLASNLEEYDDNGTPSTRVNHYQIDLSTYEITAFDRDSVSISNRPSLIKMISGKAVVVTQTQEFSDLTLSRQYWDQDTAFFGSAIATAASKDSVMAYNNTTATIEEWQLSYNDYAEQTISATPMSSYQNDNFSNSLSHFVADTHGENIYTATSVTEWSTYDGSEYIDQGVMHADDNITTLNVTNDSANNSYFYRYNPLAGFTITKYDNAQTEVWSQVLSTGTGTSYLMPSYQRVISYDSGTETITILPTP
ncbi:BACON domain-containing carbohydrate-binding protein [Colwelliaceae bacterium 6471]